MTRRTCHPDAAMSGTSLDAPWRVGVLDRRHAAAVSAMRRAAYAGAGEFRWHDPARLDWSSADDAGVVLGLWDADTARDPHRHSGIGPLQASVRLSVYGDASSAENFLEHALDDRVPAWPALLLSRAATRPGLNRQGCMGLLRLAYLAALPATPLQAAVAVVYHQAPRVRSMCEAGFRLHAPSRSWDSEADALMPPRVAVLSRSDYERAACVVATQLGARCRAGELATVAVAAALRRVAAMSPHAATPASPADTRARTASASPG